MKNFLLSMTLATLVMGFASCSKEIDDNTAGGSGSASAIQFSIKNGKGALVTYADIAEGDQWTVGTLDVYAFSGGNMVGGHKMTAGTDYTVATSGGTSTITVSNTWLTGVSGSTVNFYFVGNDAASTGGAHLATPPTTEAAFVEVLTNKVPDTDSNGKVDRIKPLLLFSSYVKDVALSGKVQKDIVLTRRDARFDIKNELYQTFQINEIYVSNANIQGYIFGAATGVNTPATGSHETIPGPAAAAYNTTTFLATSIFHLYPTTLGKAADGKTEIVIKATIAGNTANFTLKGETVIEANHRYILKLDPVSLTFSVTVADYDEGDEVDTELGGDDAITLNNFSASPNFNQGSLLYQFDSNAGGTFSFNATTTYGTQARLVYVVGNASGLTSPISFTKSSTTTYSGIQTVDAYTVTLPKATTGLFHINLEVYSPNGAGKKVISFTRGAVNVSAVFTDPAFAQWIKDNITNGSNVLTPEQMVAVTEINLSGITNITSLAGLGTFPNLTTLKADGNTGLSSVDLSGNPLIESVSLRNCNLSAIDLSNNTQVTFLDLFGNHVSNLDLSNLPKLDKLVVPTDVTTLDLTNNTNLTEVWAQYTNLTTFTVNSNNTKIEGVYLQNNLNLVSVDVTALKNVKKVYVGNCPLLTSLNVNGCTKLVDLRFGETAVATIDISTNAALEVIVASHSLIPSIDVRHCANLRTLNVAGTGVTSLDLKSNLALQAITFGETGIATLDISKNTKIKDFHCATNTAIHQVIVWDAFDVASPASVFTTRYYVSGSPSIAFVRVSDI